ncbi:MAG: hypothetical protein VX730_07725 [Pseudomonadota bacterium]|nr:hypothetical protein [Pseudomonadota bacterium]
MKYTKLILTTTLCVSVGVTAFTQTTRGEGLSRQMTSLKNMMESFANSVRPRIDTLESEMDTVEAEMDAAEAQINALTAQENRRTACNDRSTTSIYWPDHPEANGSGCVSHEDLGGTDTVSSGNGCGQVTITWTGSYGSRALTCTARTSPTPHGVISSTSDAYGGECSHDTNYGTAFVRCNNGSYEIQSNSFCRYNSNGEWRGDCR